MAKIVTSIATLSFVGYLPAPGTMGALAALPVAYLVSLLSLQYQVLCLIAFHGIGFFFIGRALPYFSRQDPQQIILDEFVGTLVTFVGISYSPVTFFIGFALFRLFDIFKPLGITYVEKLPRAYGVLLDDTVAGLFANCVLRFLFL